MRRIAPGAEAPPRPYDPDGGYFHGFPVPVSRRAWRTAFCFLPCAFCFLPLRPNQALIMDFRQLKPTQCGGVGLAGNVHKESL